MLYLKTYETFDLDKYNEFIRKYKKSDYISKRTIKTMKELGIDKSFRKLENQVDRCISFVNRLNDDILEDLLLDLSDEFNAKLHKKENYIYVKLEFPLDDYQLRVSESADKISLTDMLIRNIKTVYDRRVREYEDRKDSFVIWMKSKLKTIDYVDTCKIYPAFRLEFEFIDEDEDGIGWDDEYEHEKKTRIEKRTKVSKYLKDFIINRYLEYNGHNVDFEVRELSNSYYPNKYSTFEIKIKE